jgi:tripartite-type tricarboxylate transporter receptor subunit TctC
MKRSTLGLCLAVFMCLMAPAILAAQVKPYPDRSIDLVVPLPPGSIMDTAARMFAEDLGRVLGVKVIVLNKPGASLTTGTDFVVRSKKDGYALAYTASSGIIYSRVTNPETVPYDPDKDLEPLGLHLFLPLAIAVQASSPWKTFADFVDHAKKNPQKVRFGTNGQGTIDHFNMGIIESSTGAEFTHVPFKGGEATNLAVLGGHVEAVCHAFSQVIPHVDAGKLRALLVSNKLPSRPDLPTINELGYKQGLLSSWFALYAPAGIPEEVKRVLVPAIKKAINNPDITARLNTMGNLVDYKSPEELRGIGAEDYRNACTIAEKLGLRKK